MNTKFKTAISIVLFTLISLSSFAQQKEVEYQWPEDSKVSQKLTQWQNWKFGVIIHWGAYSEWEVVESWSLCPEDESWCIRRGPFAENYHQYTKEYEKIPQNFNPEDFNPDKWAKACKEAGMKYLVFTTKHHDGFCMFDSKYTDYKITGKDCKFAKNPKSNVAKEVFDAFRKQDFGIGAYFSKPDWHNNDYWWPYFPVFDRNVNYNPEKYPEKWKNFQQFVYNQIEELMTDYGNIDILWLDGGWVRPEGSLTEETKPWLGKNQWIQDVDIPSIAKMAREKQEGMLIVDRTIHGEFENYRTPEQQIPDEVKSFPWESCITLCSSWYSTNDREEYKSAAWAIHTLIKIISKGGNFLLGIGPNKTGDLVPEVYQRLQEIGTWMNTHSGAIYNTKPLAPYQEEKFCFTQSIDGKTKYVFYLIDEDKDIPELIDLPSGFPTTKGNVKILGCEEKIEVKSDNGINQIKIPESIRNSKVYGAIVFVIK